MSYWPGLLITRAQAIIAHDAPLWITFSCWASMLRLCAHAAVTFRDCPDASSTLRSLAAHFVSPPVRMRRSSKNDARQEPTRN
ncbi:hypothetical protein VFPPC_16018 [Pochonia chlamydosporia 170]|uniref:Uncharacterized protein n=1 Tax=Pochonia chlamydosporia 170 TaxID=1380566 RepID=A0A179FN02_METCM|nr:hypothetical protein VFPPC_16018 [Pochonia chlamydosporia 170]OAQ66399.1 hypothetical protein VFPPC_16018 [Pochonia chlamydosporia 170]